MVHHSARHSGRIVGRSSRVANSSGGLSEAGWLTMTGSNLVVIDHKPPITFFPEPSHSVFTSI
jgi:hypothetical protein